MKEISIKLNQIVTQKELREKRRGSMHALSNSFKRNMLLSYDSTNTYGSSYQCKLPEVNFSRKDLSIILRYLLYKQEMQPSDRNLLRRILLGIFQEEMLTAGSKKFVNYLKLIQGTGICEISDSQASQFYFVLKGKGTITSGLFNYNVKQGDNFGQIEILSNQRIQSIEFKSKFLLLKLDEKYFDFFFRAYYEKIYVQKQMQTMCIKENFLDKIPLLNKYMFWNRLEYKSFSAGQKIVVEGENLKYLYFVSNNNCVDNTLNKCIGLSELLRQKTNVRQTIYCNRKAILPYVVFDVFNEYILSNMNQSFIMNMSQSSTFDKFKINTRISFQEEPERIKNFMNIKIVKLKPNRSRLKTDVNQFYETNFKFFKQNLDRSSLNPEKFGKQTHSSTKTRYQRLKNIINSKPLRNNFV